MALAAGSTIAEPIPSWCRNNVIIIQHAEKENAGKA